jgi:hypothetical protein
MNASTPRRLRPDRARGCMPAPISGGAAQATGVICARR